MEHWMGKRKAVTFSYDDGVEQDRRLAELLNRYGLKATFNLNSGIMTAASSWEDSGVTIRRMNAAGLPKLYAGHEIAGHMLTHANPTELDDETLYNEILLDKRYLEQLFSQEVVGMAYPYGSFDDRIVRIARDCGMRYARTVWSSDSTSVPTDLLRLRPTAHHNAETLFARIDAFLADASDEPQLLYIWGHSYEFDVNGNWGRMEELCRRVAGHSDIFYGTNAEVLL